MEKLNKTGAKKYVAIVKKTMYVISFLLEVLVYQSWCTEVLKC